MVREKYNLIQELQKKNEELRGKKRLALVGQGDFPGANNVMRGTMNIKHHTQHLTIDNPEFPFFYDGKENITGETSSFYKKTKKKYTVFKRIKKYDTLMKGKSYFALYFLYCKDDDSWKVVERKEVENLTENYGFCYNNDVIDSLEEGDSVPEGTVLTASTSYDESMNTSIGINGRILYGVHPAVQDDAIIVSESFAKRMVANTVTTKTIALNENTIILNLYGKNGEYRGLPNIGDVIGEDGEQGILCATRTVKETRMFSDLRDSSLRTLNSATDTLIYGEGEVIDINVYCNNPEIKRNRVNAQILQYYIDAKWFYTEVYKTCKHIVKSGSKDIDREIHRWMRKAMNYLDTQAVWAFNDNVFSNLMVEVLLRKKEPAKIGRKIVGKLSADTKVS
jgi:hypothetical protein